MVFNVILNDEIYLGICIFFVDISNKDDSHHWEWLFSKYYQIRLSGKIITRKYKMSKPNRLSTISQQEEDEFRLLEAAANAMTLDEYDEGSIPSSGSPVKDVPGAFIGRDRFPVHTTSFQRL